MQVRVWKEGIGVESEGIRRRAKNKKKKRRRRSGDWRKMAVRVNAEGGGNAFVSGRLMARDPQVSLGADRVPR